MTKLSVLVLGICAVLTYRQIPRFSDDVVLWQAAARVAPLSPRPAVNLAAQYIVRGDYAAAEIWIAHARTLVMPSVRKRERLAVLQVLDRQQSWIDAFSASR